MPKKKRGSGIGKNTKRRAPSTVGPSHEHDSERLGPLDEGSSNEDDSHEQTLSRSREDEVPANLGKSLPYIYLIYI